MARALPVNPDAVPTTARHPPPAGRNLPGPSLAFLEAVDREAKAAKPRRVPIDPRRVRLRKDVLLLLLSPDPAQLSPRAPDLLPGIHFAYGQAMDDLTAAWTASALAVHGNRQYPAEAKAVAPDAWTLYSGFRSQLGERLGSDPASVVLKVKGGVNGGVQARNLLDVYDGLTFQYQLCTGADSRAHLVESGLFPEAWAPDLEGMIARFGQALFGGATRETTLGEGEGEVQKALLKLEIVLSRAKMFLWSFVSKAAAEALEEAIPKRHFGRGGGEEEEDGEGEEKDSKEGKDGETKDGKTAEAKPAEGSPASTPAPSGTGTGDPKADAQPIATEPADRSSEEK